jgi:hypothetical protein
LAIWALSSRACPRAQYRREPLDPVSVSLLIVSILDDTVSLKHCENMKNITVSLDEETYRRARMIAAQRDTSVSALVRRYLIELASGETQADRLKREERALRDRITAFRGSDRLSRDEAHGRST